MRMKTNGAGTKIKQITELLGPAVLLRIETGKKKPVLEEWQKLTLADMTADYLSELNGSNPVGVSLGLPSNGLCTVDADDDEFLESFLQANPKLRDSLVSRGERGGNVWVRIRGDYPRLHKLKLHGKKWGEWRSTGGQTIIQGRHPSGCSYTHNGKEPLEIAFSDITWPEGLTLPWVKAEVAQTEPPVAESNSTPPSSVIERARRYVATMEPAISGNDGHGTTFHVACVLSWGFALSESDAWTLLCEYNQRCQPPWSEKELQHKLDDVPNVPHEKQRGHLIGEARCNARTDSYERSNREADEFDPEPEAVKPPFIDLGDLVRRGLPPE